MDPASGTLNPALAQLLGALKVDPDAWSKIDPTAGQQANAEQARIRYERASIIARGVSADALAVLRGMTIEAIAWDVQGLGLLNAVGMGIMREGQNSVVRWIEQQKAIAAQGPAGDVTPAGVRKRRAP